MTGADNLAETNPVARLGGRELDFAGCVVRCIVALSDEGEVPATGSLSVPLGLTLWMRRFGVDTAGIVDAIFGLRDALLQVAGLEPSLEPVPLRVADPVTFVLNLAAYLDGLVSRAGHATGLSRGEVTDAALEVHRAG
jgi:hypothetical protein